MSDKLKFLDALFGVASSARFNDSEVVAVEDFEDFLKEGSARRVDPVTPDGAAFVFGVMEDASADDWRDCKLQPTAALYKEGVLLLVWAFDELTSVKRVTPLASALGMDGADEPLPLPGVDGWRLITASAKRFYSFDEMTRVYGSDSAPAMTPPPWDEDTDLGTYGDATLRAAYDENAPDLAREIIVSTGRDSMSTRWKPVKMPIGQLIALFSQHKIGEKDGPAVVLADMVEGRRVKSAIKSIHAIGLDLDDGVPTSQVDAALKTLGVLALRYTTHSHMKSSTDISRDGLVKWSAKEADGADIDDDLIRRYLKEKNKYADHIVETAVFSHEEHRSAGIILVVTHDPVPKHRIIIPLKTPFEIDKEGATQGEAQERWKKALLAIGDQLGLPVDHACLDVSRLFYLPRHGKGKPYDISLFGGPLFDWKTLTLDNVWEDESKRMGKTGGKSVTAEGRALGRWAMRAAHGFQIVSVIEQHAPDHLRHQTGSGYEITCPFDDDHSNPGDPEDRACFAVNAGDGPTEWFTVSCRHETCRDKTNLDMVGKMIADGWFPEEVLNDEDFNIAELEDAPNPTVAKRIDKEDKTKKAGLEGWQAAIEDLTPETPEEEIDAAIRLCVEAGLGDTKLDQITTTLKGKLSISIGTAKKKVAKIKGEVASEQNEGDIEDPLGRRVFSYRGEMHFDEAFTHGFKVLRQENAKFDKPMFCCVQDQAVRMSIDKRGRIAFAELTARSMWSELNERLTFVRLNDQGAAGSRQQTPVEVSNHVYEQAYKKLPHAPEIIYTPLYVRDDKAPHGVKVLWEPGWYRDLEILMADTGFNVPEISLDPSEDEVDAAVAYFEDKLTDFPFLDVDENNVEQRDASFANCMAMIITPFMRRLIDGCTPVFFIAKPMPGTGGTYLGTVPMILFDGAESAPLRYTQSEEEMQKALLASIMETRSHLFFDDVKEFNNRALLQSITSPHIGGRLLGATKTVERPNTFNWVATGNNPNIYNEMERRIVWIRLNLKDDDVQERIFKHPNLLADLKEEREIAVHHILTLIQNWVAGGAKPFKKRSRASFEDWAAKVGGVLHDAGIPGFLDNRRPPLADADEAAVRVFVREWHKRWGLSAVTPAEMFSFALDGDMAICDGNNDDQKKTRFHKKLPSLDGRTFKLGETRYMVRRNANEDHDTVFSLIEQTEKPSK